MSEFITDDTKATLLLCGVFGSSRSEKPLSQGEYTSLVNWLVKFKMCPSSLLNKENILEASIGSKIEKNRLENLLSRGVQLAFEIEEWQKNGIWILSRSDSDYPFRIKKHLKSQAPPILFGIGNRSLLSVGGLAIVGSRDVDSEGEYFTKKVAKICASNKIPIISGGARGVDSYAMTSAIEAGGISIGILSDSLFKRSLEKFNRNSIAEGNLLLISPFNPNAGFSVGNAMSRNKLIYSMADYALIVSSDYKKGGTWAGAEEELKRETGIPVFTRIGESTPLGNSKLLNLGAYKWTEDIYENSLKQKLDEISSNFQKKENLSLFELSV